MMFSLFTHGTVQFELPSDEASLPRLHRPRLDLLADDMPNSTLSIHLLKSIIQSQNPQSIPSPFSASSSTHTMSTKTPLVALFGYDSSTFTLKVRLALRLKQIPYTFVSVPTMMPRPLLRDNFHLTYRKIPVLAIGREVYCDSSIIMEALEHFFPESEGYQSLYPKVSLFQSVIASI